MRPLSSCLVLTVAVLCLACGPIDSGPATDKAPKPPAMAIPTHVLTEKHADAPVNVPPGDRIEIRLHEPADGGRWVPVGDTSFTSMGPEAGEIEKSKRGPERVFRYATQVPGQFGLSFAYMENADEAPERTLNFSFNVF